MIVSLWEQDYQCILEIQIATTMATRDANSKLAVSRLDIVFSHPSIPGWIETCKHAERGSMLTQHDGDHQLS